MQSHRTGQCKDRTAVTLVTGGALEVDVVKDDPAGWNIDRGNAGPFVQLGLGLAEQRLAGDEGLRVDIFPQIAKNETSFLVPDLRYHLAQRAGFLEARQHLADDVLPHAFRRHHVTLGGELAGYIAHQLGFHHPLHCPSLLFYCDGDTAGRVTESYFSTLSYKGWHAAWGE